MNKNSAIINTDNDIVLVCLWPGRYVADNMPSGKQHIFEGAGSKVKMSKSDAELLLKRYRPVGCCGAPAVATPYFEVAS